jgi:aminopeptidase YwaD
MVSLKTARALQQRLGRGESVRLHAIVRAAQEAGAYDIATATIRGTELPDEEIVFSCHLDHPRPGANDNASGCATILEVARTLSKLIAEKRLAPPRRTIRFVWPPEIEGTITLLNGRPQLASRIKAAIHLDMVGGGPETKAIFHVTRGPASQPSFIYDVADAVGDLVNAQSAELAMTGSARWPMVAASGSKDPLRAEHVAFTEGSDHEVYSDSSWGIPAIYLNDWPDRYIHTNGDVAANIDATKLGRAGFIAAASGYALAMIAKKDAPMLRELMAPFGLERRAAAMRKKDANVTKFAEWYEEEMSTSVFWFMFDDGDRALYDPPIELVDPLKREYKVYMRNRSVSGPMTVFGYDYFNDHYKQYKDIRLDEEKRYEALNLVDGKRMPAEIANALSAIYGPTTVADVEQYLAALASIGVVTLPSGSAP